MTAALLAVCLTVLIWAVYTSSFGVVVRAVVMMLICPSEMRPAFLATLAALGQECGATRESEWIEQLGEHQRARGKYTSIKVEVVTKESVGFGMLGKARQDAINKTHDEP